MQRNCKDLLETFKIEKKEKKINDELKIPT